MAELLDEPQEETKEKNSLLENTDEAPEPEEETISSKDTFDEMPDQSTVPDKYKGKSIEELVRMHQEAEKVIGRQGSETGELRKIVDEFILSKTQNKEEPSPAEEVDFFGNPEQAVNQYISKHPSIQKIEKTSEEARQRTVHDQLQRRHPDMNEIVVDENFQSWVGKSKVRTDMLRRADVEFDFELADELLTLWKERKGAAQTANDAEKTARKESVKKASTGGATGSGEKSKKMYRRADIIELMQRNPDRYEAMQDEITLAYREGRVK